MHGWIDGWLQWRGIVGQVTHSPYHVVVDVPIYLSVLSCSVTGYKMLNKKKSKLGGSDSEEAQAPSDDMLRLINALQQAADENDRLAARILELEARLEQYEGPSHLSASLSEARLMDAVING